MYFYNISIVLNKDGTLSAACENEILKVTKDMRIAEDGDLIKKSILNIADSIKSTNITLVVKVISPNQIEFYIGVMSKDLLLTFDEVDEYVTVNIKYLITFYDSKTKESGFFEDAILVGVAALGVLEICIFVRGGIFWQFWNG